MKNNPFCLDFGAEPGLFIPRLAEHNKIIQTFESDTPSSHIFILTGVRGSGKTVLMTTVSHQLRDNGWMHVDLNPESDMLSQLASGILKKSKNGFPKMKFAVSVKGVSVSVESDEKYRNVQTDLDSMMETLKKHRIRLLITLDEAGNTKNIREFTNYFQHCIREEYPVFIIMTGLYKNIRALQNNRTQTFLRRAPRIDLGALNLTRISMKYAEVFGCNQRISDNLARMTCGYSYGFQVLGYLIFEAGAKDADESILSNYKLNLEECSYDKIWEELSVAERKVMSAIASLKSNIAVKDVRESLNMDSNMFSTYRDVLVKSGVLSSDSAYGRLEFALPFFAEYVLRKGEIYE